MKRYPKQWIQAWCQEQGWTDLFLERYRYWAFPPGAVLPQPIPMTVLQEIKLRQGLSPLEKACYGLAMGITLASGLAAYYLNSPMPLVLAFTACALVVAFLEDE